MRDAMLRVNLNLYVYCCPSYGNASICADNTLQRLLQQDRRS